MLQPQKNPAIAGFPRIYTLHFLSYIFLRTVKYTKIDKLKLKNINIIDLDMLNTIFYIKYCI